MWLEKDEVKKNYKKTCLHYQFYYTKIIFVLPLKKKNHAMNIGNKKTLKNEGQCLVPC